MERVFVAVTGTARFFGGILGNPSIGFDYREQILLTILALLIFLLLLSCNLKIKDD